MQDRCMVWAERTIGSEIIRDAPDELLGHIGHVESCSLHLETMLVSVQDMCIVRAKHNIASEILLDALDGTPR
jgi:hypothetical protein